MKKNSLHIVILSVVAICMAFSLQAQESVNIENSDSLTSSANEKKERVTSKFDFYGKAGLSIMSSNWGAIKEKPFETKPVVGFDLSFGFISHFRPTRPSNFYWGIELSFAQIGGAFNQFSFMGERLHSDYEYTFPTTRLSKMGIGLAPVIGWKKSVGKNVAIDLHYNSGLFVIFKRGKIEYTSYHWGGGQTETKTLWTEGSPCFSSIKFGLGVWIKRFNIDLSYRMSFISYNIYPNTLQLTKCNSYSNAILSFGYQF